jgi:hypothetical protein
MLQNIGDVQSLLIDFEARILWCRKVYIFGTPSVDEKENKPFLTTNPIAMCYPAWVVCRKDNRSMGSEKMSQEYRI